MRFSKINDLQNHQGGQNKGTFNAIIYVYKTSTKRKGSRPRPPTKNFVFLRDPDAGMTASKKENGRNIMKQALFIGAIASVLTINSVLADTVVTSRNYVDTQDALKQDKITAGTTGSVVTYNGAQNGQTQFSERGIFDPETGWENGEIVSGHEGDLLDAGSIFPNLVQMNNMVRNMGNALEGTAGNVITYDENGYAGGERGIYDGSNEYDSSTDADKLVTASALQNASNNMPAIMTTNRECYEWVANAAHTDENCLLWRLVDQNVYGRCNRTDDCAWLTPSCDSGTWGCCSNGRCACEACSK